MHDSLCHYGRDTIRIMPIAGDLEEEHKLGTSLMPALEIGDEGMGRVGHPPGLGRRAVGQADRKRIPPGRATL